MEMMYNEIEGTLPLDLWLKLPKLQRLNIPVNNSTDLIPKSISNASQLVYLDIAENAFTGHWASARLERDCRALRGSQFLVIYLATMMRMICILSPF